MFDLRHGVDTQGPYSTWTRNLRQIHRWHRHSGFRADVFVDLGSGAGKACLYMSGRVENVIGVERVASYLDFPAYRKGSVQRVQADVSDYVLPNGKCLIFMFNPFGRDVLEAFLRRNFDDRPLNEKYQVAYVNDEHRWCLELAGFSCYARDPVRKISLWQR